MTVNWAGRQFPAGWAETPSFEGRSKLVVGDIYKIKDNLIYEEIAFPNSASTSTTLTPIQLSGHVIYVDTSQQVSGNENSEGVWVHHQNSQGKPTSISMRRTIDYCKQIYSLDLERPLWIFRLHDECLYRHVKM